MSVEVDKGINLFLPDREERRPIADLPDLTDDWENDIVPELPYSAGVFRPSFVQHFLNDVESLWWIGIFSQSFTCPTGEYNTRVKENKQHATLNSISPFYLQLRWHDTLFNGQANRLFFLTKTAEFEKSTTSFMPKTTQQTPFKALKGARAELVKSYWAFEKTFTVGPKSHFIYEHMALWMRRASNVAPKRVTMLKQIPSGTKRKISSTMPKEESQASVRKRQRKS